jgi:hypothetical protein
MPSTPHRLPNFFIVGAPKAGTTSLYNYLAQHPDIYMSPIKEPCHFSTEIRPENFSEEMGPGFESAVRAQKEYLQGLMTEQRFGGIGIEWIDYLKLFLNVTRETAIGEASVLYLWSKTAAENIRSKVPHARILMILRDPVSRAFSEYREAISAGALRCSFRKYLEVCLRRNDTDKLSLYWPVLETGLYYGGVKRYLDRFPRENICIFLYEDYQGEQARVLTEIFRFLRVDSGFVADLSERHLVPRFIAVNHFLKKHGVWQLVTKLSPRRLRSFLTKLIVRPGSAVDPSPADREFLLHYYRSDIEKLASLLGRDLSAWCR